MMKLFKYLCLLPTLCLLGCGGEKADTAAPVAEVKQEAQSMTVEDLKAKAASYQKAIASKLQELEPLKAKIAEIPLAEQMGEEAKALQTDLKELNKELTDLKDRLNVYLEALKAKGEEVKEYLN